MVLQVLVRFFRGVAKGFVWRSLASGPLKPKLALNAKPLLPTARRGRMWFALQETSDPVPNGPKMRALSPKPTVTCQNLPFL